MCEGAKSSESVLRDGANLIVLDEAVEGKGGKGETLLFCCDSTVFRETHPMEARHHWNVLSSPQHLA